MQIHRAGERVQFIGFGDSVRYSAPKSAVAVPYSLSYDGSDDEVDCGAGASVVGLPSGDCTIDAYFRSPSVLWTTGTRYTLASQGRGEVGSGWALWVRMATAPVGRISFWVVDGGGTAREALKGSITWVANTWYYIRVRKATNTIYISINAGAEGSVGCVGHTASVSSLALGVTDIVTSNLYRFSGYECYVHIWNTNKGALAAVPTSPFAVDANTAARWVHSDGAGAVLTDSGVNGNNGTISGAAWSTTVPTGWTI